MKAAHRAIRLRIGLIVLHETDISRRSAEQILAEYLRKPTARITVTTWRHQKEAFDIQHFYVHTIPSLSEDTRAGVAYT